MENVLHAEYKMMNFNAEKKNESSSICSTEQSQFVFKAEFIYD